MNKYIVISGYTFKTPYETEILDLEEGLKRYGIQYKFYGYESYDDWVLNTMVKADIFQKAMTDFPDRDILWIDADAVIKGPLAFFDQLAKDSCDMSFHFLKGRELLSGTLYIRNTEMGRSIVNDWVKASRGAHKWDQKILQDVVTSPKYKHCIRIKPLPIEYVKIRSRHETIDACDGIICHKQRSREERRDDLKPKALSYNIVDLNRGVPTNDIRQYLSGKRIVMVGNSNRLLESDHSNLIDSYDAVIRFNHGTPKPYTGTKTDIWVCQYASARNPQRFLDEYSEFKPSYIIRFPFSVNTRKYVSWLERITHYGAVSPTLDKRYRSLSPLANNRSSTSTGVKMVDLLCNQWSLNVDLIGFDFFDSGTWYNIKKHADCHVPSAEEMFIKSTKNVTIL